MPETKECRHWDLFYRWVYGSSQQFLAKHLSESLRLAMPEHSLAKGGDNCALFRLDSFSWVQQVDSNNGQCGGNEVCAFHQNPNRFDAEYESKDES
jgi:hypothetical protein